MSSGRPAACDRVLERRRAVALARHFRDAEGLSIAEIADRVGRAPARIKAYFDDPTGETARAVPDSIPVYPGVLRAYVRAQITATHSPSTTRNGRGS